MGKHIMTFTFWELTINAPVRSYQEYGIGRLIGLDDWSSWRNRSEESSTWNLNNQIIFCILELGQHVKILAINQNINKLFSPQETRCHYTRSPPSKFSWQMSFLLRFMPWPNFLAVNFKQNNCVGVYLILALFSVFILK